MWQDQICSPPGPSPASLVICIVGGWLEGVLLGQRRLFPRSTSSEVWEDREAFGSSCKNAIETVFTGCKSVYGFTPSKYCFNGIFTGTTKSLPIFSNFRRSTSRKKTTLAKKNSLKPTADYADDERRWTGPGRRTDLVLSHDGLREKDNIRSNRMTGPRKLDNIRSYHWRLLPQCGVTRLQ